VPCWIANLESFTDLLGPAPVQCNPCEEVCVDDRRVLKSDPNEDSSNSEQSAKKALDAACKASWDKKEYNDRLMEIKSELTYSEFKNFY